MIRNAISFTIGVAVLTVGGYLLLAGALLTAVLIQHL